MGISDRYATRATVLGGCVGGGGATKRDLLKSEIAGAVSEKWGVGEETTARLPSHPLCRKLCHL